MKTTKTFDGKKYHYFFNGKLFRNSTRNFKYACIATSRETGNSFMVSLGNDKQSTLKSMAHCYAHYCDLEVVEVASVTFLLKVGYYMKKDYGVELIGGFDTLEEARAAADDYEKKLDGKDYKREFCVYNEPDGIHKGFCFTIF
jgi:hypothetical protein